MRMFLALATFVSVAGCSTVGTVLWRPTSSENLPNKLAKGERPAVTALSMDASRRLVMSQLNTSDRFTCSEPPPDAASSVLAKSALEATAKNAAGEYGGKFNDEFAATMLALANRSSNVEIWRTTSSTFCTLLMNGWTTPAYIYLSKASDFTVKDDPKKVEDGKKQEAKAEKLMAAKADLEASKLVIREAERDKKLHEADIKIAEARSDTAAAVASKVAAQEAEKRIAAATFIKAQAEEAIAANQ